MHSVHAMSVLAAFPALDPTPARAYFASLPCSPPARGPVPLTLPTRACQPYRFHLIAELGAAGTQGKTAEPGDARRNYQGRETGVKQEQHLQAAFDAVRPYRTLPEYLCLSL